MADNIVSRINPMPWPVVVTDPAAPNSGDPVRFGSLTGIAMLDEGDGGLGATETMVDFGWYVADHPVTDVVGGGIAVGSTVYYDDGADRLENDSTGTPYGILLEAVGAGLTATVQVLHCPAPALGADSVGAANIADDVLDGSHCAVYANDGATPGIPVVYAIAVAGGAAANEDIVIAEKVRVIDVWAQHTGGAGEANDTIQVKNGANAISDAMSWAGADNTIVRAASLDDAQTTIAAGGTLRATTTDDDAGGDVGAGIVYVLCHRIA
jgi:predicted RecA/RadA family phage recombinase